MLYTVRRKPRWPRLHNAIDRGSLRSLRGAYAYGSPVGQYARFATSSMTTTAGSAYRTLIKGARDCENVHYRAEVSVDRDNVPEQRVFQKPNLFLTCN